MKMNKSVGFVIYAFAIVAALALSVGLAAIAILSIDKTVTIRLTPEKATVIPGKIIPIKINVTSDIAVNAFTGEVAFDSETFSVDKIEYNTSIANLWVTEPWYSKAENTVYFAGGTTAPGGFLGSGDLMTIYLKAEKEGMAGIFLKNTRILKHDGLGSDAELDSIDAIFLVDDGQAEKDMRTGKSNNETWVSVVSALPSPDLNNDGVKNFADIAILLFNLGSKDMRYDLNGDLSVSLSDISLIK